mmetsp:Transcript_10588/g.26292  ORF Transcript_10588/g.26292 Transcript_10588/m.26292 type:complete len:293 (+) Transcript_10588:619-1497(+)
MQERYKCGTSVAVEEWLPLLRRPARCDDGVRDVPEGGAPGSKRRQLARLPDSFAGRRHGGRGADGGRPLHAGGLAHQRGAVCDLPARRASRHRALVRGRLRRRRFPSVLAGVAPHVRLARPSDGQRGAVDRGRRPERQRQLRRQLQPADGRPHLQGGQHELPRGRYRQSRQPLGIRHGEHDAARRSCCAADPARRAASERHARRTGGNRRVRDERALPFAVTESNEIGLRSPHTLALHSPLYAPCGLCTVHLSIRSAAAPTSSPLPRASPQLACRLAQPRCRGVPCNGYNTS